ncbi:MAG: hypothetical protein RLZZ127_263 [Planctomycetota bacterium]|jgi:hypothetical protein
MLPDADPVALCEAFLKAHAQGGLPTVLIPRGEELLARLDADPPADPAWGRFLVALGQARAEAGDDEGASRVFLRALRDLPRHGDGEAAVTAGYDQGVLQERRGRGALALAAYRTAAREGFRTGVVTANTVRCAVRAVDLGFAEADSLTDGDARLAKQAWLAWLVIDREDPARIEGPLREDLQRQLCALLLPEDPARLAEAWRTWPPHDLAGAGDGEPWLLAALFAAAADAADRFLADDGGGAPYRILAEAARRWQAG